MLRHIAADARARLRGETRRADNLAFPALNIAGWRTADLRAIARSRRLLDLIANTGRGVLRRLVDGLRDGRCPPLTQPRPRR
jgi:hypothetical protein